jgi:AcrR family transcriptional regulator
MARTRSDQSRHAILDAALALTRERGYRALTADALAQCAGVGKQTIYRWWRSLNEVILDALRDHAKTIPSPQTGTLAGDLSAFLRASFRLLQGGSDPTGQILKGLMAEAQLDAVFARSFAEFVGARRGELRSIVLRHLPVSRNDEIEATVDMLFGAMWYRLLVEHAKLDEPFARRLATLAARGLTA